MCGVGKRDPRSILVWIVSTRVEVPHNSALSKSTLVNRLKDILQKVDGCPVMTKQKLKLYRAGVCMSLPLMALVA